MRFAWVHESIISDSRLTLRQLRVMLALLKFANKQGECHPTRQQLSETTGYPSQRISATTSELADLGYLVKVGSGGRSSAVHYKLANGIRKTVTDLVTVTETVTVTDLDENGYRNGNLNGYRNGNGHITDHITDHNRSVLSSKPKKPANKRLDANEGFDSFWQAYPRKVSKAQALKAWQKLCPDEQLKSQILAGLERAKTQDSRFLDSRYTPHGATWLNAQGWEDDHSQVVPLKASAHAPYSEPVRQRKVKI